MDSTPETPESVSSEVQAKAAAQDVQRLADRSVQVSGIIAEQGSQMGGEFSSVATHLVDDARAQLREGADTQLGQLADGLDQLYRQTRALAQGRIDEAGHLVEYVQEAADWLGGFSERIHKGGLDGIAEDIRHFARRRPIAFLTGSTAAGVAVGRVVRNEAAVVQSRLAHDQPAGDQHEGSTELVAESGPESERVPGTDSGQ
jgi:hypothetical protein